MSLGEIAGLYDMLISRGGPCHNIRSPAARPTMRDDLPEIIRLGRGQGFPSSSSAPTACASPRRKGCGGAARRRVSSLFAV